MNPSDFLNFALGLILHYGVIAVLVCILLYWLFFPDKAEKVSSQMYRILSFIWKDGRKQYITHNVQGHVNDYVNNFLSKKLKNFQPVNLDLVWIDEDQSEDAFMKKGKLVVKMRMHDDQNKNLVNASMIFIANNLLPKTKHYLSDKQKKSIDLFVASKLFETQKEEIARSFVTEHLIRGHDDKKVAGFYEKYFLIDQSGLYFPVFLEEMNFLGEKVFAQQRKNKIFEEVSGLIEFLHRYSSRIVGEDSDEPIFSGEYCRFGICIVGRSFKITVEGQKPYIKHIKTLASKNAETIYLIAPSKNTEFLDALCNEDLLNEVGYEIYNTMNYNAIIHIDKSTTKKVKNHLVVLRKTHINHYVRNS